MAEIKPFRALRYATHTPHDLHNLIAPPYDVISRQKCTELTNRSPKNVIQLILGDPSTCSEEEMKDPNRYKKPAATLQSWKKDGTLVMDERPSLYVIEDRFQWGEESLVRRGLLTTVKLEDFGPGNILPHEKTLATPIQDRFSLMTATEIQESPIYMTVDDTDHTVRSLMETALKTPPIWDFKNADEPIHHRVYRIDNENWMKEMQNLLHDRPFLIADGHHRYQTALRFREQNRKRLPASDYILTMVAPTPDPGVVLTSIQRFFESDIELATALNQLEKLFTLKELPISLAGFKKTSAPMALLHQDQNVMVVLTPKENDISVPSAILNEKIVKPLLGIHLDNPTDQKRVTYIKQANELMTVVKQRKGFGFWLKPMTALEVMNVAKKGEVLPQKSTFFYPKVMSGIVFHDLT